MASGARPVECFFDGACKGNQFASKGRMWVAYAIGDEEHVQEIDDLSTPRGPLRSNNIAEYQAVILALRRLGEESRRRPDARFVDCADSQHGEGQLTGDYRVREPHLRPLNEEARELASRLPVRFRWVPRERNRAGHLLESR